MERIENPSQSPPLPHEARKARTLQESDCGTTQVTVMNALHSIAQKVRDGLLKNPLAWLLFAAFLIAEYSNYQRGKELQRVCDLLGLDAAVTTRGTAEHEIAEICAAREDNSN